MYCHNFPEVTSRKWTSRKILWLCLKYSLHDVWLAVLLWKIKVTISNTKFLSFIKSLFLSHFYSNFIKSSYSFLGDAIVYGTFTTHEDWWDGSNIHIYGHGTISGDKIPHPNYSSYPDEEYWKFRPITIQSKNYI